MKYFFCTASSLLILVVIALLPIGAAHAQESSPFYWEFIHVEIDVQGNGDMLVTETQKYVFTAAHTNERYRWLPLDMVDAIEGITVFERGDIIPATSGVENNQLWIRWQHELNPPESHTFTLTYRVIGGLHIYDAVDHVSWKAIFADRNAPVQSTKVTVRVPPSLAEHIIRFNSLYASTDNQQVDPRTIEFTSLGALPPGKEMGVKIVFPHGLLDVPIPNWQRALKTSGKGRDTNWFNWNMWGNWGYWIFGFAFLWSVVGYAARRIYKSSHGRYPEKKDVPLWLWLLLLSPSGGGAGGAGGGGGGGGGGAGGGGGGG
jgi:hypothetical protein